MTSSRAWTGNKIIQQTIIQNKICIIGKVQNIILSKYFGNLGKDVTSNVAKT